MIGFLEVRKLNVSWDEVENAPIDLPLTNSRGQFRKQTFKIFVLSA